MTDQFLLSSDDCELLLAFEKCSSLESLALKMRRDVSVISRRLQQIAGRAPVVEKVRHRWRLTQHGYRLNRWSEEALSQQHAVLSQRQQLRLGASRMFTSQVLVPQVPTLKKGLSDFDLSILSLDGSLETHLLDGTVDVAFSCGRPKDPDLAYKSLVQERYYAVAAKTFVQEHWGKARPGKRSLHSAPFLAFRTPAGIYPFSEEVAKVDTIAATFNDPVCLLAATINGLGWAILPYFAISPHSQSLSILPEISFTAERYGVWWLRHRQSIQPALAFVMDWLKQQEL